MRPRQEEVPEPLLAEVFPAGTRGSDAAMVLNGLDSVDLHGVRFYDEDHPEVIYEIKREGAGELPEPHRAQVSRTPTGGLVSVPGRLCGFEVMVVPIGPDWLSAPIQEGPQ
jgi:hypothetical protein